MSINISLHVSVFHEKTRCSVGWACVAHLSFCFVETLYRTFQGASYQVSVHLAKRFQRRRFFRNQPIRNKNCLWRPCLLIRSGQNEQSLERTFHRCFLPSFTSFGWGFQRIRLKCEKLTDDRRRTPSNGKSSHCLWQGELKRCVYKTGITIQGN